MRLQDRRAAVLALVTAGQAAAGERARAGSHRLAATRRRASREGGGEPDFRRLYFGRLNPNSGEEDKRRAFEFVVNAYRRFHNCSLEDAKRAVLALLKA